MTEAWAFQFVDGHMVPLHRGGAARRFRENEIVWLQEAPLVEATDRSRRHMWAILSKAWASIPEDLKDAYPNTDALRKRALIAAGFFDEVAIEGVTPAQAGALVTSLRRKDVFSHVRIQNGVVFQRTAKSQKMMERDEFERSKQAICQIAAELIGVDLETLLEQGE
jgi:hypothetical protein